MKIEPATPATVRQVAFNMRERDFEEFRALSFFDTREGVAEDLVRRYAILGTSFCVFHKDVPVCIGGDVEAWPNVVNLLFFATDDFAKVAIPVTRFVKRELLPRYDEAGVHRVQAIALAGGSDIGGWLQTLGLAPETYLHRYGKGGEDFMQFARVRHVRETGARD